LGNVLRVSHLIAFWWHSLSVACSTFCSQNTHKNEKSDIRFSLWSVLVLLFCSFGLSVFCCSVLLCSLTDSIDLLRERLYACAFSWFPSLPPPPSHLPIRLPHVPFPFRGCETLTFFSVDRYNPSSWKALVKDAKVVLEFFKTLKLEVRFVPMSGYCLWLIVFAFLVLFFPSFANSSF